MDQSIKLKAEKWLEASFDEETRKKVQELIDEDGNELTESFYKDLEFGTGGLRGIMGVGTNRINKYTIGLATQGLANYLQKNFKDLAEIKVAIAHDNRNNSRFFAEITAEIFSANNIKVYLFEALRPTPELSFAIREYNCQSGVVITASHNPKEYNGYKVYWEDGGQIVAPHDYNIIQEVAALKSLAEIKFTAIPSLINIIGKETDEHYLNKITALSLSKDLIKKHDDIKIVYSPIHGTGVKLVPAVLKKMGFKNIYNVEEQDICDGNFPTVISPNPEEKSAMELALKKAEEVNADLVMATDPDADRVGIAIRNQKNELVLLNGNQTASLLIYYLLNRYNELGKFSGNEYIVKTIVTSELLIKIAESFNIEYFDVLTGFKYIADTIRKYEGTKNFIAGGEESYGYLIGDFVRDKDAVISCAFIAETLIWAREQGKNLFDVLTDIYLKYGFYQEDLVSIVKKGKDGAEEIKQLVNTYRNNSPSHIANKKVTEIRDYLKQEKLLVESNKSIPLDLPKANVIQFAIEDGSIVTVRPSGTEPKIKYYISAKLPLIKKEEYEKTKKQLLEYIQLIKTDLGI